ncbi:MAG TPA: hypothetical protein PLE35_00820 [Lentisphaeria bacterium]|nr:hypothetical protein [Lentisphaeria bacterium]
MSTPVMAAVPSWYIPIKKVDYEAEALQFLGARSTFGRLVLPAPFGCYFTLLELITSKFFLSPVDCAGQDVAKALHILTAGRDSLPDIQSALAGGDRLDRAAAKFWRRHAADITTHYAKIVEWVLVTPCEGFDMLPSGPESKKEFWFDAEYLAGHGSIAARAAGATLDDVMWRLPFAAVGHLIAADARREGVKGVGRKPDKEILAKELIEAQKREEAGELHPWQRKYPKRYEPTRQQVDARLEIMKEWEDLKNAD